MRGERKRCECVGWHDVVQMGISDGKFAAESEILVSLTSGCFSSLRCCCLLSRLRFTTTATTMTVLVGKLATHRVPLAAGSLALLTIGVCYYIAVSLGHVQPFPKTDITHCAIGGS